MKTQQTTKLRKLTEDLQLDDVHATTGRIRRLTSVNSGVFRSRAGQTQTSVGIQRHANLVSGQAAAIFEPRDVGRRVAVGGTGQIGGLVLDDAGSVGGAATNGGLHYRA